MPKLQQKRDELAGVDWVFVTGHGHAPRRARLVEVLRGAARVRYEDQPGEVHTVLLKQITRDEGVEQPSLAPMPAAKPANVVALPLAAAAPDEISAWLDMGRDLVSKMEAEICSAKGQAEALRADADALRVEADRSEHRAAELQSRLRQLQTLVR
jgi:hypothetical protein